MLLSGGSLNPCWVAYLVTYGVKRSCDQSQKQIKSFGGIGDEFPYETIYEPECDHYMLFIVNRAALVEIEIYRPTPTMSRIHRDPLLMSIRV